MAYPDGGGFLGHLKRVGARDYLTSGETNKASFPVAFGENGTFCSRFWRGRRGLDLFAVCRPGWVPLRRYDPVSGLKTIILDLFVKIAW